MRRFRIAAPGSLLVAWLLFPALLIGADDSDRLFATSNYPHLRIQLSAEAAETLRGYSFKRENPRAERPSVLCTVFEGTNHWTNVALHLKGSLGSFRGIDDTPSLTLNFSKHVRHQRFHGLEKLSLNSSIQDPTRISEKMCRELYAGTGMPVPRAGYATVELNGRRLGVYVLLEGWNRQFIRRHFADARGPLYEGPFLTDIDQPLLVSFGNTNRSGLQISDLLAAARETNSSRRLERLEAVLDMERFTRLLALDLLTWNGDGYAIHANNYRIFHDRRQERFVFLPHGMDQMFVIVDAPVLGAGDGIVAWAVLSLPEGRARVLRHIQRYRSEWFAPETFAKRALELATPVSLALAREAGQTNSGRHIGHMQAVQGWIHTATQRIASVDEQLLGIANLRPLRCGESVLLTNGTAKPLAGAQAISRIAEQPLRVTSAVGSTSAWAAVQWLEHGAYRLETRVRNVNETNVAAVALKIQAPRKRSLGLDWGWDARRRAEHVPGNERWHLAATNAAINSTNWSRIACEFDLRQPVADIEFLIELPGAGEALIDLTSTRLTRLTDPGRNQ